MASCEKCWSDARAVALVTGRSTADVYHELLEMRQATPCTPIEQAGQFWDEENQRDSRAQTRRSDGVE